MTHEGKHTSGPWSACSFRWGRGLGWGAHTEDNYPIARVFSPQGVGGSAEANAHLIASAPDGLELAEDALPILEAVLADREIDTFHGADDEILRDLIDRTRAFVSKARGGQS